MAYKITDFDNFNPIGSGYPFGDIKDDDGSGNGTSVNRVNHADIFQFFAKIVNMAGVVLNSLPDNSINGYQFVTALQTVISSAITTAVAAEAAIRASADTTLQNNINSEASTRSSADTTLQNNINALVPPGSIIMWSGTSAPSGWGLCDGGGGRPNLKGKFIVGYDSADGDYDNIGDTGGAKTVVLGTGEIPSHNHSQVGDVNATAGATFGSDFQAATSTGSAASPTGSTGGGGAHENRPPFYTLAYIIKL